MYHLLAYNSESKGLQVCYIAAHQNYKGIGIKLEKKKKSKLMKATDNILVY